MAQDIDVVVTSAFCEHAQRSVEAAGLLVIMLEDLEQCEALAHQVKCLESRGDEITHDTLRALRTAFLTFLDPREIHSLLTRLDDVLDLVQAAGERIRLYELSYARPEAIDLARLLVTLAREIEQGVHALGKVGSSESLLASCRAIDRHGRKADAISRRGIARLYRETTDLVEVMKWRDVFGTLGAAVAQADGVGSVLQNIALEHA